MYCDKKTRYAVYVFAYTGVAFLELTLVYQLTSNILSCIITKIYCSLYYNC